MLENTRAGRNQRMSQRFGPRTVLFLLAVQGLASNQALMTSWSLTGGGSPTNGLNDDKLGQTSTLYEGRCLGQDGWSDVTEYRYLSCVGCYTLVFHGRADQAANASYVTPVEAALLPWQSEAMLNVDNSTMMEAMCLNVRDEQICRRWLDCCMAAVSCCQSANLGRADQSPGECPTAWDGYTCWGRANPGEQLVQACPQYLDTCAGGYLRKLCSISGRWGETTKIQDKGSQQMPSAAPQTKTPSSVIGQTPDFKCRYWEGYVDVNSYKLTTCAYCYKYLFRTGTELTPYGTYLVSINGTVFPHMAFVQPDVRNETVVRKICRTLETETSCKQWLDCCRAAEECCESQLEEAKANVIEMEEKDWCPKTWDGFACWNRIRAGSSIQASCPSYIPHAMPSADAVKTCTVNGTWYRSVDTDKEWTNYTSCLQFEEFRINIYIKLACNSLSLLTLLPSLGIFLAYRSLRRQHRIRLHINLFFSFVVYATINILWEALVVYERLNKPSKETLMSTNAAGCKILYVLTRYSRSTNFLWMFCEGLYLHRLIVKAFQPPKQLIPFYLLGWGLPWIPMTIYSIIRLFIKNDSCWVHHIGPYEWIVFIPNLVAMGANVVFLVDILRILLTQLQSHPNEPSNYRRALKATFVLVPLFGMQLFLVIYRPPLGSRYSAIYENISALIVNSQGFLVALVFCLLNGEVLANLRRTCGRRGRYDEAAEFRKTNMSVTTQATEVYTKDSPTSARRMLDGKNKYIAMKPIGDSNGHLT